MTGGARLVAATMIGGAPNRVVGHARQRGPSRSRSVSSARSATRNVRHCEAVKVGDLHQEQSPRKW